ncbi:MAG: FAD-binding protein [Candidatus Moduliflexus flocculans]|nr:FAD-binding protein [Candidatus Moduliflexus flocculans]
MDRKAAFEEAFLEASWAPRPRGTCPFRPCPASASAGPADLFFEALTEEELAKAVALAFAEKYPFYVIGGGYNLLFDDAGYRGLIVRNRLEGVRREGQCLSVLSGTSLSCVLNEAVEAGLTGLEFLAGIPGTVGGADLRQRRGLRLEHRGRPPLGDRPLARRGAQDRRQGGPGLRLPGFGPQERAGIVLKATLLCSPGDRRRVGGPDQGYPRETMGQAPPHGTACAGSYFKNSCSASGARVAAGQLLEQAGARGLSVGDAAVSDVHCNFIVNRGNARAADVLRLAEELKERVFRTFGVRLEEEVIHLRADASML